MDDPLCICACTIIVQYLSNAQAYGVSKPAMNHAYAHCTARYIASVQNSLWYSPLEALAHEHLACDVHFLCGLRLHGHHMCAPGACIYYVPATFGRTVFATRTAKPLRCAGTDAIQHMRVHYSLKCCCSSMLPLASQAVAPWQPDPDPAVHPKQWLSQAIGAPVSVSKLFTSNTVTICFLVYPGTLQQARYAM